MAALKSGVSRCGLCQFYHHEGRRGGTCNRLNSPVSAKWEACRLSASPFESGCERKAAIALEQNRWLVPKTAFERAVSHTVFSPTTVNSAMPPTLAKESQ